MLEALRMRTTTNTSRARKAEIRIGISGWTYAPWRRGAFYPEDLPQKRELAYASKVLNSIEINGSFYSLQRPDSYRKWHAETPADFVFAVKGSRFITHVKRLRNVESALANFFASGLLLLKEKLGPILWQLPPTLKYDHESLDAFLRLLPRTTTEAAALARKHDEAVDGRAWTRADRRRKIRHALEVRHDSFKDRTFVELLRKRGIALVVADTAGKWPFMEDVTSDFVYVRLHGDSELYASGYTPRALATWKAKLNAWCRGRIPAHSALHAPRPKTRPRSRDVFVYFDNDVKVRAPYDAMELAHLLGLRSKPGPPPKHIAKTNVPRQRWPGFRRKKDP
jgi:uncharacterized protein YecE (DUF72 family)